METRLFGKFKMKLRQLRVVCLLPLLASVGCAAQYDCYTCGRVSCSYCPPKPLPFASFESCNCNDSIGQAYAAGLSTPIEGEITPDYYRNPVFGDFGAEAKSSADAPEKDANFRIADK